MKHITLCLSLFVSLLIVSGCKKDVKSEASSSVNGSLLTQKTTAQQTAALKEAIANLRAAFPEGLAQKLSPEFATLVNTEYREKVLKALKVITPTSCDDNTLLNQWLGQRLANWTNDDIFFALDFALLDIPTYYALVFENSSDNQYFGQKGEYTQSVTKTFKDLQRFWDMQYSGIVLTAMHGNTLTNAAKVNATLRLAYGLPEADATFFTGIILSGVLNNPVYEQGNHPIFTFNAFAQRGFYFQPIGNIPSKIVMGDGILESYTALGYGDVAPQAVLAHEYGHHIQYLNNVFGTVRSPEATRRTELMADAFSAYYLSHPRGASMQWKRVQEFLQVFFNIGDCAFADLNHHGTPTQRMAAAQWGYNLANDAQKQGHILTGLEVANLFDAQLASIVSQ